MSQEAAPGVRLGAAASLDDASRGRRAAGPGWLDTVARYAAVVLPAAAMAVAGLCGLTRDNAMGNDEVATRWAALLSLRSLAHLLRHVDGVHGLYYVVMHGWVVFGSSPTVLRIPSVVAMTAGAALLAILAIALTGSRLTGLFAGLVMALTPFVTYYAQTARSYALVFACVTAMTLVLVRALAAESRPAGQQTRSPRPWWIGYAVLVAVAAYLNEMALLALAAHAVTVLLARPGRRVLVHWLTATATGAVVVLPLLALSVAERGALSGLQRPGIAAVAALFRDYFGATLAAAVLLAACALVALLPARGVQGPGPWWRGGVCLPSVALPILVVPAVLLLAESAVGHPLYFDRYVLYGEAGAALLAGAGVVRAGQWLARLAGRDTTAAGRSLRWLPGVLVCALALVLQLGPYQRVRTPASREFNFGGPSSYVGAHARRGDGVLYFDTLFRKAELGYPQDFAKVTDVAVAVTPRQAGNFRGTDLPVSATVPLMLSHQRIWILGATPSRHLPEAFERQESATLLSRFRLVTVQRFQGVTVTLWQRR